jgi:serine/threonine protein phosphatase PrpC
VTLSIEAAGITHRGTVREGNEDCIAVGFWSSQETMEKARRFDHDLAEPFVCIVADGMGGQAGGEFASQLVATHLAKRLTLQGPSAVTPTARAVNTELYTHVREHPERAGMGSTAVGLVADRRVVALFNVGDSRAYRVGEGKLVQLSMDDSMSPNWKSGMGVERNNKLLQSFGGRTVFSDIQPNVHREPLEAGNTYLLCCDGLYETLLEETMAALVGADLVASAEALLKAALEKKARDNVTVALIRVKEV